ATAGVGRRVGPGKGGPHNPRRWLWVPALAALGPDDDPLGFVKNQPAAVGNDRPLRSIVPGLLFTMDGATSTCRAVGARSADLPSPRPPPVVFLLFTRKQRSACRAVARATRTFRARGAVTACRPNESQGQP